MPISSVDELIDGHSILPYFRLFNGPERYEQLRSRFCGGFGAAAKISLGLLASRLGAEDVLRFCPVCATEDVDVIGTPTWYRVHQLPGVLICPYHLEPLVEDRCLAQRLRRQQLFLPDLTRQSRPTLVRSDSDDDLVAKLLIVARLSAQLLSCRGVGDGTPSLLSRYKCLLLKMDLATENLRIRQAELCAEFSRYWSGLRNVEPFAKLLATCHMEGSWLQGLCRKRHAARHPLKHVLLIGFLTDSIESLIHGSSSSPTKEERIAIDKRPQLEQQLQRLIQEGRSLRRIAALLRVSPHTVLVAAEKMGVRLARRPKKVSKAIRLKLHEALAAGDPIPAIKEAFELSSSTINRALRSSPAVHLRRNENLRKHRLERAKANFLREKERSPNAGFKSLRSLIGSDFAWLYRNDRQWLFENMPKAALAHPRRSRLDWTARDNWMVEQVRLAVNEIRGADRPIRVTICEIGRRTGYASWLEKHLTKLPATRELLAQVIEPVAAFQLRRLSWWERQLSPQCVARWKVLRAAGLERNSTEAETNLPYPTHNS